MIEAAQRDPKLLKAAVNIAQRVGSIRTQEQKPTKSVQRVELIKQPEAQPTIQQPKTSEPLNEYSLRQKLLIEQKAKLARDLKVVQYGRININCKNAVG